MWSSVPANRWAPEHKGLTISPNDSQSSNIFSPNCLLMDHMNFYSKVCDLSKSQLCAGGETKSGACQGDSGSGLVVSFLYLHLCLCLYLYLYWPCGQLSCCVVLIFNSGLYLFHADILLGLFLWTNIQTLTGAL